MFVALFAFLVIGGLYRWTGQSPQRERIGSWPAWKAVACAAAMVALAIALDPDYGFGRQGAHMWAVGPFIIVLLIGAPVLLVRWFKLRA